MDAGETFGGGEYGYACALTRRGEPVCVHRASISHVYGRRGLLLPPASADYAAISAGLETACALTAAGEAVCWRSVENKTTAPPSGRYVAVSDGPEHTCALTGDGEAACWGWNTFGQTEAPPGRYM